MPLALIFSLVLFSCEYNLGNNDGTKMCHMFVQIIRRITSSQPPPTNSIFFIISNSVMQSSIVNTNAYKKTN